MSSTFFHAVWLSVLCIAGCVGTDLVNAPVGSVGPRIDLNPVVASVDVGGSLVLTATYRDSSGMENRATMLTWSSSDASIATVDRDGVVAGHRPGECRIVASFGDVSSPATIVTVVGDSLRIVRRVGILMPGPITGDTAFGTVVLEKRSDGVAILRFGHDFRSMSGPGLHVFLSPTNAPEGIDLGSLKQTSGAHDYQLPLGTMPESYDWVVVRCVPFNVTFGSARLEP